MFQNALMVMNTGTIQFHQTAVSNTGGKTEQRTEGDHLLEEPMSSMRVYNIQSQIMLSENQMNGKKENSARVMCLVTTMNSA